MKEKCLKTLSGYRERRYNADVTCDGRLLQKLAPKTGKAHLPPTVVNGLFQFSAPTSGTVSLQLASLWSCHVIIIVSYLRSLLRSLYTWVIISVTLSIVVLYVVVQVVRMPVANCSGYGSCEECLAARDPYCGWCSFDRKYDTSTALYIETSVTVCNQNLICISRLYMYVADVESRKGSGVVLGQLRGQYTIV